MDEIVGVEDGADETFELEVGRDADLARQDIAVVQRGDEPPSNVWMKERKAAIEIQNEFSRDNAILSFSISGPLRLRSEEQLRVHCRS